MRRVFLLLLMLGIVSAVAQAQTDTPTPMPTETMTPTPTPTPEPWIHATLAPEIEGEDGQMTRFDYVYTAGDVMVAVLLVILLLSLWGMFIHFNAIFGSR